MIYSTRTLVTILRLMQLLRLRERLQQCTRKQHSSKCRNSFCLLGRSLDYRHIKLHQVSISQFNSPTSQYCFVHKCNIDYPSPESAL